MLYDLPAAMQTSRAPQWPEGIGSIPATLLPDGTPVQIPILKGVNMLTFGVVGTGKTKSITEPAAEILLKADPAMKGVFFEIKRSFIDRFMGAEDKVLAHDPTAVPIGNLFVPNIIKEIRQAENPEAEMKEFAAFLFGDLLEGANQNLAWVSAAQNSFIGVLRVIVDCYPTANTTNKTLVNALRRMTTEELLAYLARHPRNHSMLRKDWGYEPGQSYKPTRRAQDISFFLNQAIERFCGSFELDGEDTLLDWLNGRFGQNLFFLYDLVSAESCRPFFLYYLKKLSDLKMSNGKRITEPILMVLDEVDKLSFGNKTADFGLFRAANLGRELGLQLLVTTQSMESLYCLSPNFNEHITNGGLAGFPYLISFRAGDPTTLETLQRLYGSEHKERVVMPASRYTEPVVKVEKEPIITDNEIASLGTGDCIVKLQSHRPQKVHLSLQP